MKTLKVRFEDLQRMRVPDFIVTLFDFNVQNADINSHLQDELTDVCMAQSLFKRENLRDSNVNSNIAAKCSKLCSC